MIFRTVSSTIILTLSIALVGAGCKKTITQPPTSTALPSESNGSDVYLPPPPLPESEQQRNLKELRAALQNFQQVKTFRSKLIVDRQDSHMSGQIDVVKPDRFHGILKTPEDQTGGEVIGIAKNMYVRIPTIGWIDVSSQGTTKTLAQTFGSVVDGSNTVIQRAVPDETVVSKQRDDAHACDAYQADITPKDSNTVHLTVCVKQNLPALIEFKTDEGSMTLEYYDYNALFTIERPTITKIQVVK